MHAFQFDPVNHSSQKVHAITQQFYFNQINKLFLVFGPFLRKKINKYINPISIIVQYLYLRTILNNYLLKLNWINISFIE